MSICNKVSLSLSLSLPFCVYLWWLWMDHDHGELAMLSISTRYTTFHAAVFLLASIPSASLLPFAFLALFFSCPFLALFLAFAFLLPSTTYIPT